MSVHARCRAYLGPGLAGVIRSSPGPTASAAIMVRQILGQATKHPSSILLLVFTGEGGPGAALCVLCLALFDPDVSWGRKNNPEP